MLLTSSKRFSNLVQLTWLVKEQRDSASQALLLSQCSQRVAALEDPRREAQRREETGLTQSCVTGLSCDLGRSLAISREPMEPGKPFLAAEVRKSL